MAQGIDYALIAKAMGKTRKSSKTIIAEAKAAVREVAETMAIDFLESVTDNYRYIVSYDVFRDVPTKKRILQEQAAPMEKDLDEEAKARRDAVRNYCLKIGERVSESCYIVETDKRIHVLRDEITKLIDPKFDVLYLFNVIGTAAGDGSAKANAWLKSHGLK